MSDERFTAIREALDRVQTKVAVAGVWPPTEIAGAIALKDHALAALAALEADLAEALQIRDGHVSAVQKVIQERRRAERAEMILESCNEAKGIFHRNARRFSGELKEARAELQAALEALREIVDEAAYVPDAPYDADFVSILIPYAALLRARAMLPGTTDTKTEFGI